MSRPTSSMLNTLPSSPPSPFLYAAWNNRGIDLIFSSTSPSCSTNEKRQEQLIQAVTCFHNALQIGKDTVVMARRRSGKKRSLSSEGVEQLNGLIQLRLSQKDYVDHHHRQGNASTTNAAWLFTRFFELAIDDTTTTLEDGAPPSSLGVAAATAEACSLHCAAMVFNLALANHLISLNHPLCCYRSGIVANYRHPETRMNLSLKLYRHCWSMLNCLNKAQPSSVEKATRRHDGIRNPFMVCEMLMVSCLNNLAFAYYDLADYDGTVQCFVELLETVFSSSKSQEQEQQGAEEEEEEEEAPTSSSSSTEVQNMMTLEQVSYFPNNNDYDSLPSSSPITSSAVVDYVNDDRHDSSSDVEDDSSTIMRSIWVHAKRKFTQNLFVYCTASIGAPAA